MLDSICLSHGSVTHFIILYYGDTQADVMGFLLTLLTASGRHPAKKGFVPVISKCFALREFR